MSQLDKTNKILYVEHDGAFVMTPEQGIQIVETGQQGLQGRGTWQVWEQLVDGPTVFIDCALGHRFRLSAALGRTFGVPINGYAGQQLVIALENTSGGFISHTMVTGSAGAFRYGEFPTVLTAVDAGKVDYITVIYNDIDNRWDILAQAKGY